jgi:AraC-like DNA-binding protein
MAAGSERVVILYFKPMIFYHDKSKLREEFYYCPQSSETRRLPVYVELAGSAMWKKGDSYERRNSWLFGIELILGGNCRYVNNGKEYLVGKGEIFMLQLGSNHRYDTGPAGKCEKRFATISGPMLDSFLKFSTLDRTFHIKLARSSLYEELLKKAYQIMRSEPPDALLQLSVIAYNLLIRLREEIRPQYPEVIQDALSFMQDNLHKMVYMDSLLKRCGLSQTHFTRLFKQYLGVPPLHYFESCKLQHAEFLLRETSLSIKEIGHKLGYENPFYFTTRFKKRLGIPPQTFRNR